MKTLPNGITVFNATPHAVRFWREDWSEPVEVETDVLINAKPVEYQVAFPGDNLNEAVDNNPFDDDYKIAFVRTEFVGDDTGKSVIDSVPQGVLIVGSIIAAQAYPGQVVAMTPAPGYERVAPAEKKMNPDKFTVF
jgi:hypothetical protein